MEVSPSDLAGAGIVAGAFLAVLLAAEAWARLGRPDPEWPRKLVHLGGGLACLLFPFVVESPAVVCGTGALLAGAFVAGRRLGALKSLHGVARPSRGAEYYPLAISLSFLLSRGRPWLYVAAVLVLAVADALAALVGSSLGRIRFRVGEAEKSLEGSAAFLGAAFVSIALPARLGSGLPPGNAFLDALLVSLLVTGFEIVCRRGSDNLLVPFAVCVALDKITSKPLAEIQWQCGSLAAISLGVGIAAARSRALDVGGAIAVILFAYAAWSLGSPAWAAPAFLGFVLFLAWRAVLRRRGEAPPTVSVVAVSRALLVPFGVLAAANATSAYGFFFPPYLAASGAVLGFALQEPGGAIPPGSAARFLLPLSAAAVVAALVALGLLPRFDPG